MGELYDFIDTWDANRLFTYIVIFIVILWLFSRKDVGINILVGIIIAAFAVSYFNQRSVGEIATYNENLKIKQNALVPKIKKSVTRHNDIINFLYSIQDMYVYNPSQYEVMVKNIDTFYDLYDVSMVDQKLCYINYGLMEQYKRDALNALMSIVYQLPDDKRTRELINNAAIILDNVMTKHLDQISYCIDNYTYKNGYSTDTKIINYGPKPYNEYDDIWKPYSYEIY